MRMRISRPSVSRSRYRSNRVISFTIAIICLILGFLMFQPFFWLILVFGQNYHYIAIPQLMMIVGLIIGAPLFLFGLVNLLSRGDMRTSSNTSEIDISRIRHTVETSKMEKK